MAITIKPEHKKWLYIGGAVVGAYVIYRIASGGSDNSGSAIDPTGNGGTTIANPNFNASKIANDLYDLMSGWFTSDTDILAILQEITTPAQFGQVVQKFGSNQYNSQQGTTIGLPFIDLPKRNLPYWLKNELSDQAYAVLKKKYPQYL